MHKLHSIYVFKNLQKGIGALEEGRNPSAEPFSAIKFALNAHLKRPPDSTLSSLMKRVFPVTEPESFLYLKNAPDLLHHFNYSKPGKFITTKDKNRILQHLRCLVSLIQIEGIQHEADFL